MSAVALHYREHGRRDAPPVLLAPSIGTTNAMWDDLAAALAMRYRVIRFDTRGHGGSPVPDGPYSTTDLADDTCALADSLGIGRFALVGLSIGGASAQTLAARSPERLTALVLCCTNPVFGTAADWHQRAATVRARGMSWLVEPTEQRWFPAGFAAAHPHRAADLLSQLTHTPPEGYAGCCEALATFDATDTLRGISTPTRIIIGDDDPVSPPSVGRTLRSAIPDSDLVTLPDAAHLANIAQPRPFNDAVINHLDTHV